MCRTKTKNEVKKVVKEYAKELEKNKISFKNIYLFGSFVSGKADKWSDIDIAIVSDKFKRNKDKKEDFLWHLRRKIDSRIEPHIFTIKDFSDNCDPMVYEIKKTGIKII